MHGACIDDSRFHNDINTRNIFIITDNNLLILHAPHNRLHTNNIWMKRVALPPLILTVTPT